MRREGKLVTGVDGRQWLISSKIIWGDHTESFEHEKGGGRWAIMTMIILLGLLWAVVGAWGATGTYVSTPWWMLLILLGIVVFFPSRWVLRRPRRLLVQGGRYPDDDTRYVETWSGEVRGRTEARLEYRSVIKTLEKRGTPARANSPLQPH